MAFVQMARRIYGRDFANQMLKYRIYWLIVTLTYWLIFSKTTYDIKKYFTYTGNVFEKDVYEKFEKIINAEYDSDDSCNKTLIHGSCKIDNIMIHGGKPYFIDWSLFRQGYGVEDILFLL